MTPGEKMQQIKLLENARESFEKGLNIYAYFKLNNKTLCRDLVQDTFIKAWMYIAKGKKIEKMKSFLYHILNDLIVDQYRKLKAISLDALVEIGFEPKDSESDSLLNLSYYLDCKASMDLVERLPEGYKKIIKMRFFEELSMKEIASLTGSSVNNIGVKLHRGLEKLRILCKAEESGL